MDKLESFIRENREAMDRPRDPEAGWEQLRTSLPHKHGKRSRKGGAFIWKVAAILFFISSLALSAMLVYRTGPSEGPVADGGNTTPGTATVEGFYLSQIQYKKEQYRQLAEGEEKEELLKELEAFDSAYEELKLSFEELQDEALVQAMIENLRLRVLILNEQIELLKYGEHDEEMYYHES
jgi:hypothetical protein